MNLPKNIICAVLLAGSALAADNALLRNGFSIRHERREALANGAMTRLYLSAQGNDFVDVKTAEITGIESETEETLPQPIVAPQPSTQALSDIVRNASDKTLLDEDLLYSVIKAESGSRARAVSSKGAQGLMQLMPRTAKKLGVKDAFDPRSNVDGGSRYLHEMLACFNFDLAKALAAYNAGPEAVARYNGVPPYRQTRLYVACIIKDYNRKKVAQAAAAKKSAARTSSPQTSSASPPSKS